MKKTKKISYKTIQKNKKLDDFIVKKPKKKEK